MEIVKNIEGNEIFKNLFEHSVVGMSITSVDNRLNANAAFCNMIGYTLEELKNRRWHEYTHPDDIAYNRAILEDILSNEKRSYRWEKRYIHKDGSVIWADIHTFLHRDENGEPLHFITTVNDISARKKAEEENELQKEILQKSNAEKDKFFAILAHDLRSPLSSFLGLAEAMAEDIHVMSMKEVEEITKSLYSSASSLFQLLENLLEWSLLKKGNFECRPEKISLNRILLRSIDPIQESAKIKNIDIKINLSQTYFVNCDLKMTETIFRNLVSNALKYTNPGGSVEITAEPLTKEDLKISVLDNGIGMNKDLLGKLFQMNEQISRKGTEGESSSGLGLLICKEFAEKQGGSIWAESEEGKGSTFHFTLKFIE
jgi:PAS domain S-box-containing protein